MKPISRSSLFSEFQSKPESNSPEAAAAECLICHFQPVVSVAAGSPIFGHECLTRFRDSQGKEVSIAQLFTSASERKLKRLLHTHILRNCLANTTKLIGSGRIFININPQFFYEDDLHWSDVLEMATKAGVKPEQIVWEIVETDRIEDDTELIRFARECRAVDCQVALDDWGSQLKSLDLLERVRPDFVKLERELLAECTKNNFRATMVSGIIEMCRQLEIKTIVEGVETIEDWNWVRRNRADYAQGFYLGRPASSPVRSIHPATIVLGHHFDATESSALSNSIP